ncbi:MULTISPECIES: hypothetical protein [Chryseobacterium]|uniref:hypothetical protein n=1 Tax=Chryseobacterium TaxID=59732 RepID=UPI0016237BF5|nr:MULTISPECIES: hypothetical protein [Chryseobacterium]MDM1555203.1 hypothetical protein [Chryseobacterium indologenes]
MKKLFLVLMATISLSSCSQKKEQQLLNHKQEKPMDDISKYIFPEARDVTEANFVEKISSQIKHYDKEPLYYFRINKENCLVRAYLNNVNIYDDYELSNVITPTEISNILKSGPQKVTVKMYPVGDLINKDLGLENEPPVTKLSDKAKVDISVVMMDHKSKKGFDDEKIITTQVNPKGAAGKGVYEFSFTFNAEVPYEFEGWTKGQDLRKLDQALVQKKALEFYDMVGRLYLNKDLNSLIKLDYVSNVRTMASSYVDKSYVSEFLEEYKNDVEKYEYKMEAIKDFDIEFMGDGKLVRLINRSQRPKLRGGSALLLTYGSNSTFAPELTLYLPEGRDLATQGFMMWK